MKDEIFTDSVLGLGDTLLRFVSSGQTVVVPHAPVPGSALRVVGSGSVVAMNAVSVRVEEGYTHLEQSCISTKNSNLEQLVLPKSLRCASNPGVRVRQLVLRRSITPQSCQFLSRGLLYGPPAARRLLLTPDMLKLSEMQPLEKLLDSVGWAVHIPSGLRIMFMIPIKVNNGGVDPSISFLKDFTSAYGCLDFSSGRTHVQEEQVIREMISQGDLGFHDPEAELNNDRLWKKSASEYGKQAIPGVMVLTSMDAPPILAGTRGTLEVNVSVTAQCCRLFTPALCPIRFGGQTYYLYSRNIFTSGSDMLYWRQDVAVCDRKGYLTNRTLSQEIYAKHRFISLL